MFLTHVSDGLSTVGVENMYTHFCTLAYIQHTMTHAHVRTHAQGHTNKSLPVRVETFQNEKHFDVINTVLRQTQDINFLCHSLHAIVSIQKNVVVKFMH